MIWLEAENGYLETPMQVDFDDTASSGEFIWIPNGNGNVWDPSYRGGGQAEYTFNIPQSGNYVIWGLVIAENDSNDSFFVAVDEGDFALWDTKQGAVWTWDQVNSRYEADPVFFNLEAGEHSLVIKQREDGTRLDRILITNDLEYIPK